MVKIQPYIDKLNNSKQFQDFKNKHPEGYFSSGFFVIDFQTKKNMHQLDYYIPKKNKIVMFILDGKEVEAKETDPANKKIPGKIDSQINLDLDILKGLVEDEMKNQTVTTKLQKIIAVIQNIKGKLIWNLNCITTDMGVLKVHIDDESHSILNFEKINLFDVIKKLK